MADNIFRLAGLNVPIIKTIEIEGDTPTAVPNLSAEFDPAMDYWASGVLSGTSRGENGVVTTESYATDESTALTDDTADTIEIISRPFTSVTMTFYAGISVYRNAVRILQEQNMRAIDQANTTANQTRTKTETWVALRYKYTNPSTEWAGVYGYAFASLEEDIIQTPQTVTYNYYRRSYFTLPLPNLNKQYGYHMQYEEIIPPEPDEDPNEEDPDYPSSPSIPDPDHTPIYDPIPIPNLPTLGSAGAGFITMYKLGLAAINQFTGDMFVDTVWEAIKNYFGQPMDFLVGCMLLPFEPETGSSYYPKFGDDIKFEHAYPAVSNQYKEIDCGTVFIKNYWGSCFDYEPFTKIQIWLPYIGYRDLSVDEIMGNSISVKYHCDCLTGDCVAFILDNLGPQVGPTIPRVIAQFYGNCGVRVPFGSVSYDAAVAAGISLIGAAASMGLSKGSGVVQMGGSLKASKGMSSGAQSMSIDEGYSEPSSAGLVGATVNMVESMKPNVQKGGAAGASNGYMSIQKPYLIRRIPRQNLPADYVRFKGYPSNISGTLADFSGYAEVDDIQLNDIPAMSSERAEIIRWLSGGVLI